MFSKLDLINTGYFIDNEYLDRYSKLLFENVRTYYQRNKTNDHHIIPVLYFKHRNIEVNNTEDNKVTLLFKDHVLAHLYLYYCSLDERDTYSNACAIRHLMGFSKAKNIDFNINSEDFDSIQVVYEDSKKHFSMIMKDRIMGNRNPAKRPEVRKKISESKKGHPVNPETNKRAIEAMRKANIGSDKSRLTPEGCKSLVEKMRQKAPMKNPETVEKMRKSVTGLRRVTNGVENKTIKPE